MEPTIRTDGGFEYEEGEGLDEDEVAANSAKLPVALAGLPGGGLGHGAVAYVDDQVQEFHVQIEITHKVCIDRTCAASSCLVLLREHIKCLLLP